MFCEFKSCIKICADSSEPEACFRLCVPLSSPPLFSSLSLSKSKETFKNIFLRDLNTEKKLRVAGRVLGGGMGEMGDGH